MNHFEETFHEAFPHCFFSTYWLEDSIEKAIRKHEVEIRKAVLKALRQMRSGRQEPVSPFPIFVAVVNMTIEMFDLVVDDMRWIDDNNPPDAYEETVDHLYADALKFARKKYKSTIADIPGFSARDLPRMMTELRRMLIERRETIKNSGRGNVIGSPLEFEELPDDNQPNSNVPVTIEPERRPASDLHPAPKRGRPVPISIERKTKALMVKEQGGTNRDAAIVLYDKRRPTSQEVKNVSAILRFFRKSAAAKT